MYDLKNFSPIANIHKLMGITDLPEFSIAKQSQMYSSDYLMLKQITPPIVFSVDTFSTNSDLLYYNDKLVVIYCFEQNIAYPYSFHLSKCNTVVNMITANLYDKYCPTIVTSGEFAVEAYREIDRDSRIKLGTKVRDHDVCDQCLAHINYKGYNYENDAEKKLIKDQFCIEKFLNTKWF